MFTMFVVGLAVMAIALLGCLLVATGGCIGAVCQWFGRRRTVRSARVAAEADAA